MCGSSPLGGFPAGAKALGQVESPRPAVPGDAPASASPAWADRARRGRGQLPTHHRAGASGPRAPCARSSGTGTRAGSAGPCPGAGARGRARRSLWGDGGGRGEHEGPRETEAAHPGLRAGGSPSSWLSSTPRAQTPISVSLSPSLSLSLLLPFFFISTRVWYTKLTFPVWSLVRVHTHSDSFFHALPSAPPFPPTCTPFPFGGPVFLLPITCLLFCFLFLLWVSGAREATVQTRMSCGFCVLSYHKRLR